MADWSVIVKESRKMSNVIIYFICNMSLFVCYLPWYFMSWGKKSDNMIIMKGFCEDDFLNFHERKRELGRSQNFLLWRHNYILVVMVHVVIGNPSLSVCQKSGKGVLYSIPFDNYFIVFSLTYQRCFGSFFSLYNF